MRPDKNRTAWGKVKNIIQTHRPGSFKGKSYTRSLKSLGSVGCSRDVSPYDSNDGLSFSENFESNSSSQTSPIIKNVTPSLTVTTPPLHQGQHNIVALATLSLSSDDYEKPDLDPQKKRSLFPSGSRKGRESSKVGSELPTENKNISCGTVKKNSPRHHSTV